MTRYLPFTCLRSAVTGGFFTVDQPQPGAFGVVADPCIPDLRGPVRTAGRRIRGDAFDHRLRRRGRGVVLVCCHDARHRFCRTKGGNGEVHAAGAADWPCHSDAIRHGLWRLGNQRSREALRGAGHAGMRTIRQLWADPV